MSFSRLPIPLATVFGESNTAQIVPLLNALGRQDLIPVITTEPLTAIQQFNFGFAVSFNQGFGDPNAVLKGYLTGWYWQDNFRVTSRLNVNYGVRYDLDLQPGEINRDYDNIAPRFGFAYQPFENGRTVVRGGVGMYYQSLFSAAAFIASALGKQRKITNLLVTPDARFTPIAATSVCGATPDIPPSFCFMRQLLARGILTVPSSRTIPQSAYASLLGLQPATSANRIVVDLEDGAVNPYGIQGSFGVDHQLGRDWNLSLNYLVNHGLHALRTRQVNALPNPQLH